MESAAAWLEATALARLLSESGWLYAWVNTAHVLGVALLVGAIAVLDLRLIGLWRSAPVEVLARPAVAVAATGLGVAAVSGAMLLIVQASEYVANPLLWVKFGAIGLGLVNIGALRLMRGWRDGAHGRGAAPAGLLSLGCWLAALTAGRMIAYW